MRCRLILLISEHPIQQGIRKGGVRIFGHERRGEDEDRMAYSRQLDFSALCNDNDQAEDYNTIIVTENIQKHTLKR